MLSWTQKTLSNFFTGKTVNFHIFYQYKGIEVMVGKGLKWADRVYFVLNPIHTLEHSYVLLSTSIWQHSKKFRKKIRNNQWVKKKGGIQNYSKVPSYHYKPFKQLKLSLKDHAKPFISSKSKRTLKVTKRFSWRY